MCPLKLYIFYKGNNFFTYQKTLTQILINVILLTWQHIYKLQKLPLASIWIYKFWKPNPHTSHMFPKFPAVQELQKYTNTIFSSCSRQESCTQCLVCSTAFGESWSCEILETGYAVLLSNILMLCMLMKLKPVEKMK